VTNMRKRGCTLTLGAGREAQVVGRRERAALFCARVALECACAEPLGSPLCA
jgi:hypothetical protein